MDNEKKSRKKKIIEMYINKLITYEELIRLLEDLDELPPPPVIY